MEDKIKALEKIFIRILKENNLFKFNKESKNIFLQTNHFLNAEENFERSLTYALGYMAHNVNEKFNARRMLYENDNVLRCRREKLIGFLRKNKCEDLYLSELHRPFILKQLKEQYPSDAVLKEASKIRLIDIFLRFFPSDRFFYDAFLWSGSKNGHTYWHIINDKWLDDLRKNREIDEQIIELYNKRELFNNF